jgi:hypothetical protein
VVRAGTGSGACPGEAHRSNPYNKSIQNKYNKQIELTPTSILMTNHDNGSSRIPGVNPGDTKITLNDDIVVEGIMMKVQ